jgi:rhomboid protease GluP
MKKETILQKAPATLIIILICSAVFAAVHLMGMSSETEAGIVMGAYYKPLILAGEWWRLLTVGFVHIGLLHLLMNMISFWSIGTVMEKMLGKRRYLIILFVSVIGGSLFLFASGGNPVAVGISGGLYGLLACYIMILYVNNLLMIPQIRNSVLRMCFINLLINFYPGVSYAAHLGGCVTGLILSLLLVRHPKLEKMRKSVMIAGAAFCTAMIFFCSRSLTIPSNEIYLQSDYNILKQYETFGFKNYAVSKAKNLDTIYGTGEWLENSLTGGSSYE